MFTYAHMLDKLVTQLINDNVDVEDSHIINAAKTYDERATVVGHIIYFSDTSTFDMRDSTIDTYEFHGLELPSWVITKKTAKPLIKLLYDVLNDTSNPNDKTTLLLIARLQCLARANG